MRKKFLILTMTAALLAVLAPAAWAYGSSQPAQKTSEIAAPDLLAATAARCAEMATATGLASEVGRADWAAYATRNLIAASLMQAKMQAVPDGVSQLQYQQKMAASQGTAITALTISPGTYLQLSQQGLATCAICPASG